jgi:hypothetical protein
MIFVLRLFKTLSFDIRVETFQVCYVVVDFSFNYLQNIVLIRLSFAWIEVSTAWLLRDVKMGNARVLEKP